MSCNVCGGWNERWAPVLAGADARGAQWEVEHCSYETADVAMTLLPCDSGSSGSRRRTRKDCYAECDLCAGSKIFDHGSWKFGCGTAVFADTE